MSNIMLTNLSLLTGTNEVEYNCNINGNIVKIKGIQTNEAATKYYISYLSQKGESLRKIICLATEEVQKKLININDKEQDTTQNFFKKRIKEFCKDDRLTFRFISLNDNNIIPEELIEIISDSNAEGPLKIYIDTTGGKRDDINRLQLIIKFLTYKRNISIEKIVYSNYDRDNADNNRIEDVDVYDIIDILDGVSQFTDSGQSHILASALKTEDQLKPLLSHMNDFTESLQLCQTNNLDFILSNMKTELERLTNSIDAKQKNNKLIIFKQMIPIIEDKFFGVGNIKDNIETSTINYISIIRWCLKNNLIQQALTIYIEYIPDFLLKNKIFVYSDSAGNCITGTDHKENYDTFYIKMLSLESEKEEKFKEIVRICNENREDIKNGDSLSIESFLRRMQKKTYGKKVFSKFKNYISPVGNNFNKAGFISSLGIRSGKFIDYLNNEQYISAGEVINTICKRQDQTYVYMTELAMNLTNTYSKECKAIERRIDTVNDLNYWNNHNQGVIKIKDSLNINIAKRILYDYLFIKVLRNKINHASEDEITYFSPTIDYETLRNGLRLKNVKYDIENALNRLENI